MSLQEHSTPAISPAVIEESKVVIRVTDVSKRFVIRKEKSLKERLVNFGRSVQHREDFYALKNVSLDIEAGTTVGLIGPNGSGKSTLLKTIGGIIQPSSGSVMRKGRLAALLELGAGFHPDLTGRENVYLNASILGISREATESHFEEIVDFAGIGDFIDTQVKFYSSGMYVRLAFAVAVHVDPDILIVDEVLAVGDEPFQRKCIERIKSLQRAGKTIIIVTHSLDQVGVLCDRAVVLEHGVVVHDGEPGGAILALRENFEEARHEAELAHEAEKPEEPQVQLAISSVAVKGLTGGAKAVLEPGSGLQLHVTVETDSPTDGVVIGMGIETQLGQSVFGTNTNLLGLTLPVVDGKATVRFDVGELRLGAGQYLIHASVGTLEGGEVNRLPQAGVINVRSDGTRVGILDAEIEATVVV
jgi:ABC-2 type transport system ATP-binding protein